MTLLCSRMAHENPALRKKKKKKTVGLGYKSVFVALLGSSLSRSTTLVTAMSIMAPLAFLDLLLVNSCVTLMKRKSMQKD